MTFLFYIESRCPLYFSLNSSGCIITQPVSLEIIILYLPCTFLSSKKQVQNKHTCCEIVEYYLGYRRKLVNPAIFKATMQTKLVLLENAVVNFHAYITPAPP